MPSYPSFHALLHDFYITAGRSLARQARSIEWTSRRLLERTRILGNLARARTLRKMLDRMAVDPNDDDQVMERFEVHYMLIDCYDVIVDDLLLISAFENYAKATLLTKGYVVHQISKPAYLKKQQRVSPVHIQAIRAEIRRRKPVKFSDKTVGLQELVSPAYSRLFPFSPEASKGLEEVRSRRNQIHFNSGFGWTVTHEALALVGHLAAVIPKRKNPWARSVRRGNSAAM